MEATFETNGKFSDSFAALFLVCPQWPSVDECPPQEDIEMDSDCYPGKSPCPAGLGCCRHGCYFECKGIVNALGM